MLLRRRSVRKKWKSRSGKGRVKRLNAVTHVTAADSAEQTAAPNTVLLTARAETQNGGNARSAMKTGLLPPGEMMTDLLDVMMMEVANGGLVIKVAMVHHLVLRLHKGAEDLHKDVTALHQLDVEEEVHLAGIVMLYLGVAQAAVMEVEAVVLATVEMSVLEEVLAMIVVMIGQGEEDLVVQGMTTAVEVQGATIAVRTVEVQGVTIVVEIVGVQDVMIEELVVGKIVIQRAVGDR